MFSILWTWEAQSREKAGVEDEQSTTYEEERTPADAEQLDDCHHQRGNEKTDIAYDVPPCQHLFMPTRMSIHQGCLAQTDKRATGKTVQHDAKQKQQIARSCTHENQTETGSNRTTDNQQ